MRTRPWGYVSTLLKFESGGERTYGPEALKHIESLAIVVGDAIVLVPVCRRGEEGAVCCVPMALVRTNFRRYFLSGDGTRPMEHIVQAFLGEEEG